VFLAGSVVHSLEVKVYSVSQVTTTRSEELAITVGC